MGAATELHKQSVLEGARRLKATLAHVPDDKLTWSPSPTAKSPLRVAAHAALSCRFMAGILRGEPMPGLPMAELKAMADAAERAVGTREELLHLLDEGVAEAVAVIEALTPERLAGTAETPFGTMPMTFMVQLPGRHLDNHAAQIDYLQSVWGDMEFHV